MDLGGDLGAVVRASRQDCSHAPCSNLKIDGLEIDSYNLLNSAAVLDSCMKEVPISISISKSNSNTVTCSPFYDCKGTARSQSLPPSMFESLELYNHPLAQKAAAWSYATAESSLSGAEGKAQKNDQDHDLIMPTDSTNNEEEASGPIRFAVVCPRPTLSSSPPRSVHVKSPPRFPTRHDDLSAKTPDREADCSPSSPIMTDSIAENKTIALVTKRRKIQQRRTVCIPATEGSWNKPGGGGVPSDLWAWRKYGQKPIKGSPYPRGYYRCSSCKGCPARKQVERSHTDPTKLVITYTADHNHAWPTSHPRNGLALRESSASTHKDMIALVVPHSPQKSDVNTAQGPNPVSPTTDIEQEKPRSQAAIDCLDFNLMEAADSVVEDHDQTAGLHMLRSNHMHYDDLFADLGELKDFARYFADYKSDEETGSTVDPYNLFNW